MSSRGNSACEDLLCHICLDGEAKNLSNPLISPCKCSGTMKYTHLNCLRLWMNQRIEVKSQANSAIVTWKSLSCELCKSPYPFAVYFNGKIYELINCQLPEPPYAIFECYSKDSADSNGLCVISFSNKNILRMGRHGENDVMINDVSVSRRQAVLQWDDGWLFVCDVGSKFGTLAQLRQPRAVGRRLEVQCGKSLVELGVKKTWSIFGCFEVAEKSKLCTEETKMFPEDCLPGEGKHSVLVVTKKEYNKLLKPADKIKRAKTPVTRAACNSLNRETVANIRSLLLSKKTLNPRSICDFRHAPILVMKLKGDNTDGIDDGDCQ